jgi:hypothetical protein
LPIIRTRAGLEERALVGRVRAPAGHEGGEFFFVPRV